MNVRPGAGGSPLPGMSGLKERTTVLSTDYVTGSPSWLDLGSPDPGAAVAFYGEVFGWDHQSAGPDAGGYGFFQRDGRTVAALGPLTESGASPAWTVYFHTPDADATVKAAEQGGGAVRVEPFDVLGAGRMACLTDPGGAEFAVWQPAAVTGLEQTSAPHTLLWVELHTADTSAAFAFYRALFGWRREPMGVPGMTYDVLSTGDGDQQEATFGGIAPLQGDAEPARWVPYFHAPDTDGIVAAAQAGGGTVLMPATDVPGVGRIAWLADPFGAPFAVLTPKPGTAP